MASAALCTLALCPEARAIDPAKPLGQCAILAWRARDGLPGPWVRAIAQTPDGYLWVATYGGIARYDGARFVPIGSTRLFPSANDIADLTVAPDGRLWISPSNGPPLCPRGDELESCLPKDLRLPTGARLTAVLPESDGSAWIATRDDLFHLAGGRLVRLGAMLDRKGVAPPLLPFGRVVALRRRAGELLLATDRGLFRAAGASFALVPGLPEGPVDAIAAGAGDTLWLAAPHALVHAEGAAPIRASLHAQGWPAGRVSGVLEDRHGNVWIAGASGLTRFRNGQFHTYTEADGLPDADVTAVFEDREGGLWVGTRGGGLAQFTDRTLDTHAGPPELRREMITSVAEDGTGAVWLGTRTGAVRWEHERAQRLTTADGLPSENVNSVLPDPSGGMWIGTNKGLVRWEKGHVDPRPLYERTVYALHIDRTGALWIGGQDVVLRWQEGRLDRFGMEPGLKGMVRAIGRDDAGEMWLGAIGGLGHLQGGRFVEVPTVDGARIVTTRAILLDRGGTLWISTNAGLVARANGRFRLLAGADPALIGQIYQVFAENSGHLWVGTTRGLARLDPRALWQPSSRMPPFSILSFDTSDRRRDATATATRQPGVWRMRDGRLWFSTDQGVLTIAPAHLPIDTLEPAVVIERADLDGRAASHHWDNHLPPGPGNLEFHYSTITLVDAHRAKHRYRLEGFDRDWVEAGTRRVAQYTNIPPGHYRFRVQGSNADGVWNETGDSVSFTLAPHFYATRWFYLLVGAALLALTFAAYRVRLAGLRRAYLAAFAERSRVARELHDTLLQGMSAIGMQLRGIRRKLERTAPASARELESVEDMVTMSLDETRRFVWNLREQSSNVGDLGVALARLGDRLTQGRSISCHTRVDGQIRPLPNGVQDQLFRIAQEAVANAVKHADAQLIEIALHFEPTAVKLIISDDGRGFDPAAAQGAQAGHFGLLGMRERGAQLGELTIDSRPGEGTRVEMIVATRQQEPERSDA